jgi:hypothetical protein
VTGCFTLRGCLRTSTAFRFGASGFLIFLIVAHLGDQYLEQRSRPL